MQTRPFFIQQQQALLDLATLAMYADGHLASAEDERVHRLLAKMEFRTEYDRNKQYDAAVSRVTRHSQTAASARAYTVALAQSFSTREQQRVVLDLLDDLVSSDSRITLKETSYVGMIREVFEA